MYGYTYNPRNLGYTQTLILPLVKKLWNTEYQNMINDAKVYWKPGSKFHTNLEEFCLIWHSHPLKIKIGEGLPRCHNFKQFQSILCEKSLIASINNVK